jgi:hypothetical protein
MPHNKTPNPLTGLVSNLETIKTSRVLSLPLVNVIPEITPLVLFRIKNEHNSLFTVNITDMNSNKEFIIELKDVNDFPFLAIPCDSYKEAKALYKLINSSAT